MSPLSAYPSYVVELLGIVSLPLLVGALYLLVEVCFMRQSVYRVLGVVAFATGVGLQCWSLAVIVYAKNTSRMVCVCPPALVAAAPIALVVGAFVAQAAAELALTRWMGRLHQTQLMPDAIKEALDALPDGVYFLTPDGRPLLVNAQMDLLAHDVFDTAVTNGQRLWEEAAAGRVREGATLTTLGEADEEGLLLAMPDGRAWELRRHHIMVEDEMVVEVIATDVTQVHALVDELARRNERLAGVGERLRAYSADLTRLVHEEEVLQAKAHVHERVGSALVALRAYERQDPAQRDRASLLDTWRKMANLLQAAAEEHTADAWELLCAAAEAVDVELVVEGTLPERGETYDVVVALVHECLNNAVRHADAHRLDVALTPQAGGLAVQITNDGAVPSGPMEETGGLANLRTAVKRVHGTMRIDWSPRFAVTVFLPKES